MGGAGVAAAALLAVSATSAACTASASLTIGRVPGLAQPGLDQAGRSGVPGSTIDVVGEYFRDGAPVELHWDDAAGAELARVEGSRFVARLSIPDAEPGVHSIVAVQRDGTGSGSDGAGAVVQRAVAFAVRPAGWQPGQASSTAARGVYSMAGSPGVANPLSSGGAQGAWAAGLLGAGLVSLAGGTTLAVVRRRRVVVRAGSIGR